jgi:hypothetical protein
MPPEPTPSTQAGLTVGDVARRYRVGEDKVRGWIRRGELAAVNTAAALCGKPRWVILPEALAAFETRRRGSGPETATPATQASGAGLVPTPVTKTKAAGRGRPSPPAAQNNSLASNHAEDASAMSR